MNNFRKRIPNHTIRHVLYSHTRLSLHSKMCATQMKPSDNPKLWDIQLSSWLFCELTRQLCPWLLASSCYVFASHMMHAGNFLQASAGRLPVPKPHTSDHRLGRLPTGDRNCTCVRITTCIMTITSDYSLTGTAIHDCYIWNHCFPHEETELGQHVQPQTVHKGDRHIRSQREPVLVISVLYPIFWGFSAFLLILSWLKPNHSTATVKEHATPNPSSNSVNKLQATLS